MATHITVLVDAVGHTQLQSDGTHPDFIDSIVVTSDNGTTMELEFDSDSVVDDLANALIDLLHIRRKRRQQPPLVSTGPGGIGHPTSKEITT